MENKWIIPMKARPRPALRLFCFPYSGGSAQVFKAWGDSFPASVEVCGVQYPGRGSRFGETRITEMETMVAEARKAITSFLDVPFAFFGHSLGGGIAYDLARTLQTEGRPVRHLFISGRRAAHLERTRILLHNLPEAEFRREVFEMGGTPKQILEHPELMDLISPLLRDDLSISEKYNFSSEVTLSSPLTAFGGAEDSLVETDSVSGWTEHTTGPFRSHIFPGDHFFLDSQRPALLREIMKDLGLNEASL